MDPRLALTAPGLPTGSACRRTEAREQLRRQVGTLRFDLNTLASSKAGKEDKKKALALGKAFIKKVRGREAQRGRESGAWRLPCVQRH